MNILITGSSGFVGYHAAKYFKSVGYSQVIGLDYVMDGIPDDLPASPEVIKDWLSEHSLDGFIKYRLGSYEPVSSDAVQEKIKDVDVILHLASESHVDRSISGPKDFIDNNVGGTLELFEWARKMPNLKRIILFGTDETVACLAEGSATETAKMHCGSVYSATKGAQELLMQAYIKTHNLPIFLTRCVNIFGTEQADEKLIPTLVRSACAGLPAPIYGSGFQSRQWVHVSHVCEFVGWLAANTYIPHGTTLHIRGTSEIPNIVLATTIQALLGKPASIEHVADRLGHDDRYALDDTDTVMVWDAPRYDYRSKFMSHLKETVLWYRGLYSTEG